MPRVCGKVSPDVSFRERFGVHPVLQVLEEFYHESEKVREKAKVRVLGRPDANGTRKYRSSTDYGSLFKGEQEINSRVKRKMKKVLETRPKIRTRKTGPVGPDLDWSVIYSDVPITMFHSPDKKRGSDYFGAGHPTEEGHMLFPYDEYRLKINTSGFRNHATKPGCVETHAMGPLEVRLWTQWAYRNGVHFSGERGYNRTKNSAEYSADMQINAFKQLKDEGFIPQHSRSSVAKIRRAARQGCKRALISPIPASRLFETRYRLSAKQIRQNWRTSLSEGHSIGFKAYQSSIERGISLSVRKYHGSIPAIIFATLKKLYSCPVKIWPDKPWFVSDKVTNDLRYTLTVHTPCKRRYYYSKDVILRPGAVINSTVSEDYDNPLSTIPRISRSKWDHLGIEEGNGRSSIGPVGTVTRPIDTTQWWL